MCSLFADENIPWSSISLNKCIQKEMPISLSVLHQGSILLEKQLNELAMYFHNSTVNNSLYINRHVKGHIFKSLN